MLVEMCSFIINKIKIKNVLKLLILTVIFVTFSGCSNTDTVFKYNTSSTPISSGFLLNQSEGLISIHELNIDKQPIYYQQYGKLTHNSRNDMVAVISERIDKTTINSDVFLVVQIDDNFIKYDLGNWEYKAFDHGSLNTVDIDNDGVDEIILFMEITGNGGTIAQIFEIQNNEIELLYDLNEFDLALDIEYKDGYLMSLSNKSIGFSSDLDISKEYGPDRFDDNGKGTGKAEIYLLPIYSDTLVIEISDDGNAPIINCEYGVIVTNYVCKLKVGFQCDSHTNILKVISMSVD